MKRIICLILALLMLTSCVACGSTTTDTPVDTTATQAEESTEAATQDMSYICELPSNLSYNNQEINIIYNPSSGRGDELVSETLGFGVVSDAVYERNVAVEEMLTVKLSYYDSENIVSDVAQDIQSGSGDYQLVANGTNGAVIPAIEGNYINLGGLNNLDLTKKYWNQGYNEMATFTSNDLQFLATGPIALSIFRFMFLTLYNKTTLGEYHIDDLYDVVMTGGWTLDYQYSITKGLYADSDGDGKHSEGDFYGFVTGDTVSVDPYPVTADLHMIIRDSETGDLTYNAEATTRLSDLCDKIQLIYNDDGSFIYKTGDFDNTGSNYITEHFIAKKAMMVTTMFYAMEMNFDGLAALSYGIAPMPKYDTLQDDYHSYVQDQVSCFGISSVVGNEEEQEMCGAVLEAMAYHSYLLVRPAYYETVLSERYMQDPESKEVLDLIFASLDFDFSSAWSDILGTSNIRNALRPLLSGSKNTIGSTTRSWQRNVQKALDGYNTKLAEYDS